MQEHVGKKRRKEVRTAVDMKTELRNSMIFMICVLLVGIAASVGLSLSLLALDPMSENLMTQTIPTMVMFVFVIFLGSRSYKWSGLKKEYNEHCKRYNITKEDMDALKNGLL